MLRFSSFPLADDAFFSLDRLRLQICRSLGFEPVLDKRGNVAKILVRECTPLVVCPSYHVQTSGSESNEVHSVTFDEQKSDVEYAQLLWDLASS